MPGGDRTGPMGDGPMTGRAAGYCTGSAAPGYMNPAPGGGFRGRGGGRGGGRGRGGGGRGWRNWYYATGVPGWARARWGFAPPAYPAGVPFVPSMTREQEIELLREQADHVNETLEDIKRRIEELSSQTKEG